MAEREAETTLGAMMDSRMSFSLPSPTPTETPYRTPTSSLSHRSRGYEDMSPSSTPPPLPTDMRIVKKRSNDSQRALDEGLSPLDPRRFTPTLHASLVSEILSLRRDLESKIKSIDQLEHSLDAAQSQSEGLSKSLLSSNRETRSIRRQMQLLEGGTLSALNDLSKERDDALLESLDLRKRLELAQKRARSHDEDLDRIHAQTEKDKEGWMSEKRTLETKAQIAEGRLKTVLDEVAAQALAQSRIPESIAQGREIDRSERIPSVPGSPVSVSSPELRYRRYSAASASSEHHGGRVSALSFANGYSTNLADELALQDIEEDSADEFDTMGGRASPQRVKDQTRSASSLSLKARRVLGMAVNFDEFDDHEKSHQESKTIQPVTGQSFGYVDSAVQHSPPPSPLISAQSTLPAVGRALPLDDTQVRTSQAVNFKIPVMVSSSCQTLEHLPSPPLTPKQNDDTLSIIVEDPSEKAETKDMSTQTDLRPRPGTSRYIHSRTSTHDLGIPIIAIIPPTSRSATPETNVVLPPQTKNAGCQVEGHALYNYTTSSMQTEEIRIDKRNIIAPKPASSYNSVTQAKSVTSKGKAVAYVSRGTTQPIQPVSNSSSKRVAPHIVAPLNDDGPLATESSLASSRPIRSSSLFAGFDDYDQNGAENDVNEDIFYDDEYSGQATAKFTLRSGKMVSQEGALDDLDEWTAVNAGEAMAIDNLRRSETRLPPELRQFDSSDRSSSLKRQDTVRKAPPALTQANARRSGAASNGVFAHQSRKSQSTIESGSNDGTLPPPIPIPLRYSSARVNKPASEGGRNSRGSSHNTSPTRQHRSKFKPVLRKARSGPAISPAAHTRRPRSKTPPLDSRVSIVPEMPYFEMPGQTPYDVQPPLTNDFLSAPYEASAPKPAVAPGPRRTHSHMKQVSDLSSIQQTSVVDSIAQTMVGEWMYKYVRRRKSFGKPEKDWDPNKSVEELTSNPNSAGTRHKRWVWLAPYERAIMWSSKQPMNGNALLGKSGRKLTVKSVLDVKDDNPMPKNSLTGPAFNRSILILTPQRALKFTATNQERHFVWLTALSFLSHSPLSIGDLAALPPPPDEYRSPLPPPMPVGGSFRHRTLRDSIRIAKGPSRQEGVLASITDGSTINERSQTRPPTRDCFDIENDTALPPTIRRFHNRNRSNTAPRPLQSSFISSSHREAVRSPSIGGPSQYTPSIPSGRRGSDASASGRPVLGNNLNNYNPPDMSSFSEPSHNTSMTMRMDAFIDHKQAGKGGARNLRLGASARATNKDMSYWGLEESTSPISPVDSLTPVNASVRMSDSTGRGSVERDMFRGF